MTVLLGSAAFSQFRLDALRAGMLALDPSLGDVRIKADWVYFIDEAAPLAGKVLERTALLLGADAAPAAFSPDDGSFFVTPRKGTISPWSSKATDIFHNCGITQVKRVERGIRFSISKTENQKEESLSTLRLTAALPALYDRMTEGVYQDISDIFVQLPPKPGRVFDVLGKGIDALREANTELGLAISEYELEYLEKAFTAAGRNPTDTELVMFGQVNSEHCRHKIFGAEFIINGKKQPDSLFGMIKNTHAKRPKDTLVAYKDNSSVVKGFPSEQFVCDPKTREYRFKKVQLDQLMKVETHNHPTAISPFPGAATGVGGEIRDEAATGRGSRTEAGICGFITGDLRIPGWSQPWERVCAEFPSRLATPLAIMTEAPLGGAAFGNEFGRPQLCGFFRTYEGEVAGDFRGYYKPIMLAGGMGTIRREQVLKNKVAPGALIVQIGGPAMRIGLGGGAASSMTTGTNDESLDFNSVQRGNPEMQRRCQGVIDACAAMGEKNPIISIHDLGAGGLSNGCPELVEATGGSFSLRAVHNEEPSMNPMEIWCCEAQERYVLALKPQAKKFFEELCARERCPVAFIGTARKDKRLVLEDSLFKDNPIDMDVGVLLGKPPRMVRNVKRVNKTPSALKLEGIKPADALERILRLPAVANKTFLVTIADRSVTGLVCRDQMVGRHQLPAADCAVATMGYTTYEGQAMATGERTPAALISAPASGRLAVAEALTNLAAADTGGISNVRLSANWMAACGEEGEDAKLFDTVKTVGLEFCPALGVSIPVGKDSCSMHTVWNDSKGGAHKQSAPLSLIVSSFSPVNDVRKTLTPDLKPGESSLVYVDLGKGKHRLGASALAQVYNQCGCEAPDADAPALKAFFNAMAKIVKDSLALAYHDISDGGIAVTLAEMAITGARGFKASLPDGDVLESLFSEEPGAVIQVAQDKLAKVLAVFEKAGLGRFTHVIATLPAGDSACDGELTIEVGMRRAFTKSVSALRRAWSETTFRMQSLRDNPQTAREEFDNALDVSDPGLTFNLTFDPDETPAPAKRRAHKSAKPRMAILREQGVNGHIEMAAAFSLAGFDSVDVHMTDLLEGRIDLSGFSGLVACGGFSYGDVLGAGSGWARSILFNPRLKKMFAEFFKRPETFSLGVCNGCQMLSQLKSLIPGAAHWPSFKRNISEQFEARYATVEILESPSIFFKGMAGSRLPIAVAHGEGRVEFQNETDAAKAVASARYVDGRGNATERYPFNPNGSKGGLTAFTSKDGRATIMMPHPERGFRSCQLSWKPADMFTGEAGPWMRMFRNAYAFATGS